MIQTGAGVRIPFPERIHQKYIIEKDTIRFISFEKLERLFVDFLNKLSEPVFLFVHIPLNQKEEEKLQKPGNKKAIHSEILYLDGQSREQIYEILAAYGWILFNDGISKFGVASHSSGDEIFVMKY